MGFSGILQDTAVTSENEAKIGEIAYPTWKAALDAGGEATLLKDIEVSGIIEITVDITLNLGNFTMTNNVVIGWSEIMKKSDKDVL